MAEFLSPGVFIEEVPSTVQTIQGVSTSNLGICGFTPMGPADVASLVTSFEQYQKQFGGFTRNSFLPLSVAAFFSNGGTRAYIVRVLPSDAVQATAQIQSTQTDTDLLESPGVGIVSFSKSDALSQLAKPIVPGTFSLRWRDVGAAGSANAVQRNGTPLAGSAALNYEGRLDPTDFPTGIFDAQNNPVDPALDCVASGSGVDVTLTLTMSGLPCSLVFPGSVPGPIVGPLTSHPGPAIALGTQPGPWALANSMTLAFLLAGPVTYTATFLGTAAALTAGTAETYDLTGRTTLLVSIDGGPTQTIDFTGFAFGLITAATAVEVAEAINGGGLIGATATAAGGFPVIESDTKGLGSSVTIIANATPSIDVNVKVGFDLTVPGASGSGNVSDLAHVTFAEVQALVQALGGGGHLVCTNPGGCLQVATTATGTAAVITVSGTSTTPSNIFALPLTLHTGGGVDAVATLDRRTGFFALALSIAPDTGTPIQASYTKATANVSITDNGAGGLIGPGVIDPSGTNQLSYVGGGYNFKVLVAPSAGTRLLATYNIAAWSLLPVSKGAWANGLEVAIRGNVDFYDTFSASYSRFDMDVLVQDQTSGSFFVQETYSQLDFTDSTSAYYFPDVVNGLSSLLSVTVPIGNEGPLQLNGVASLRVIAGGDGTAANQVISTVAPPGGIAPRSLLISFVANAGAHPDRAITDDGLGNLTGNVDPTYTSTVTVGGVTVGPNSVDYASGTINVKLSEAVQPTTFVLLQKESAPLESTHTELFGDPSKGYIAGTDGTFDSTHYSASQFTDLSLSLPSKGLYALNKVDAILQVVIPDFAGDTVVTGALLDYANVRAGLPSGGDRFIILTVPKGSSPQQAVNYFRFVLARFSNFAAIYWPWIKVADPLSNNRPLTIPPMGHIAGIYARTDNTKNVGKAPAGTVDGQLSFLLGLEYVATQGERDLVYPNRINPIITSPQTGTAVWGVRTIASDPQWLYVNARRLFMFLEKSVYNSTQWIVFENNGPPLWTRIQLQLSSFLLGLYNDGYFAGNTPKDAFFVKVDNTNNSQATIDAGQVIVDVGAAPNRPAEFVRFRFQQKSLS